MTILRSVLLTLWAAAGWVRTWGPRRLGNRSCHQGTLACGELDGGAAEGRGAQPPRRQISAPPRCCFAVGEFEEVPGIFALTRKAFPASRREPQPPSPAPAAWLAPRRGTNLRLLPRTGKIQSLSSFTTGVLDFCISVTPKHPAPVRPTWVSVQGRDAPSVVPSRAASISASPRPWFEMHILRPRPTPPTLRAAGRAPPEGACEAPLPPGFPLRAGECGWRGRGVCVLPRSPCSWLGGHVGPWTLAILPAPASPGSLKGRGGSSLSRL